MKKHIFLKLASIAVIIILTANYTFAQNDYISAKTGKNLVLKTNDTERMRITTDGYVGIGVSNPTYKLEIAGRLRINGNATVDSNLTVSNLIANIKLSGSKLEISDSTILNGVTLFGSKIAVDGANSRISSTTGVINFNNTNFSSIGSLSSTTGMFNSMSVSGITEVNRIYADSLRANAFSSKNLYSDSVMYIQSDNPNNYTRNTIINNNNSGKVGIGVSNPTEKLEIVGNVKVSNTVKIGSALQIDSLAGNGYKIDSLSNKSYKLVFADENGNLSAPYNPWASDNPPGYGFVCGEGAYPWKLGGNEITDNYTDYIGTCNNWPFRIVTGGIERMRITKTGKVLIGKTSSQSNSDYILDVAGKIRADKVIVNTTGADFVFDETYPLMSLSELEKNINENKHLPEIPSAAEMQQNGMSLGETNTLLLKKIEELTLYIIDIQKQNNKLTERISNLEGK